MNAALFDEIVQRSRLGLPVAPFTVTRLLVRAGVNPKSVTPEGLERALPEFERGLAVYLDNGELSAALDDLRELASAN
jgi:hypothetical protein